MVDTKPPLHRSWSELEQHYREMLPIAPEMSELFEAMAKLCSSVEGSHFSGALFGHTSLHELRISQVQTTYHLHPSILWLVVAPNLDTGQVEFRFEDTYRDREQWRRVEKPEGVLGRFNGFLRQVGWSYKPID